MKKAVALLVVIVVIGSVALAWRHHRTEQRRIAEPRAMSGPAPDPGAISPEFLSAAWEVLLPVVRQRADASGKVRVPITEPAMIDLVHKARSHADLLVWVQIRDYWRTQPLPKDSAFKLDPLTMRDPDACIGAVMATMRAKVLHARLPECAPMWLR